MKGMRLWYSRPAAGWQQGLPIGNGRLGAVIHGDIGSETWNITESTYWSGQPERTESRSAGKADLERMRKLFFDGDFVRGEALVGAVLQPKKGNFGTNLPMCELRLDFGHSGDSLVRELSLEQAIVSVSYRSEGKLFTRETFASHADGIVASRLWCDEPGTISFSLGITGRTEHFAARFQDPGICSFSGRATESVHSNGECGVKGSGMVKVMISGGSVRTDAGNIVVQNADEAWIYLAANTDYETIGDSWTTECERQLEQAVAKGYERLKEDHIADYRQLYDRVAIELGDSESSGLPTDERIRLLRNGEHEDPQLYALFYQYGRYLMISGSRADSPLPLNLQGIWNDGEANRMAWSCDYHLDINTQMNYYPAETGNLAECHLPLMRFVEKLSHAGKSAARDFYGCDGWVAHVFSNAWGFSAPGWHYSWGLNVTGGLWIAGQLREHYEFNLDRQFLAETAYPVLKEAAAFFLDYMTVHPKYGWLVTGPSNSPENSFYLEGDRTDSHQLSMGPTMDQVLVRDLFVFCKEAAEMLQTDDDLQRKLEEAIALLPPLKVGKSGQLQEWLEDYEEAQPEHRHLSHLVALYPGNQVTPTSTPEWSEAARTTLVNRMGGEGLEDVEFTLALFAAGLARLGDGDSALKQMTYLIGQLCFDNLLTYSKPGIAGAETNIFVVDGNFGGTAAVAEMLLQSHAGEIELLPALPGKWHTGKVTGLRTKGNAEVDLRWENGELEEAAIKAYSPGRTLLRYRERIIPLDLVPGTVYIVDKELRMRGAGR
jgi:alpha-L-fucosidase 2